MNLNRTCKSCDIQLTTDNAAKKNKLYYLSRCKPCRSKEVIQASVGNPKRQAYARMYIRRVGIVKEYPCETCEKPCLKKYARAFCSDECRFLSYVEKNDSCWIWKGALSKQGYGKLSFRGNKSAIASRVSYELCNGTIENSMLVCHSCDIPSCVNPKHLWLGTNQDNMTDMIEKGRQHSKLTPKHIFELRKLWEKGYSHAKLQELYNVTSGTISSIINRRIWKHV